MGGMIRVIMSKFKDLLQVERCTVFVVNHEENLLWSTVAEDTATIKVPMGKGICRFQLSASYCLQTGVPPFRCTHPTHVLAFFPSDFPPPAA